MQVESCHSRITELQVQLEKTRELLEEASTRARAERSERDLKLMQLEGEAERAKSAAGKAVFSSFPNYREPVRLVCSSSPHGLCHVHPHYASMLLCRHRFAK
jgi:hypothetical protein